jgi:hypothetical protein
MTDLDIVTRLRALAAALAQGEWVALTTTCSTAADEIERLRAECERLRKDGLRHIDTLVAERDEARARNVRLLSQLQEYEVREL